MDQTRIFLAALCAAGLLSACGPPDTAPDEPSRLPPPVGDEPEETRAAVPASDGGILRPANTKAVIRAV